MYLDAFRGQKMAVSDSPELELQVIVSCLAWMLGSKFGVSGRTVCYLPESFNCICTEYI